MVIDRKVSINRKKVRIIVKTIALDVKGKTKKFIGVIFLEGSLYFSNIYSASGIGFNRPASPVVKVQSDHPDTSELKVAQTINRKLGKLTFSKSRPVPSFIYLMDERFLERSDTIKLINRVRGGGLIETAIFLILFVSIWQILKFVSIIDGFIPNNCNRELGVNRQNRFQPPGGHLKYPPVYDLISPKRAPGYQRQGSTLEMNRPSSIPHQEYVSLSKEERRMLPHSNNMKIIHEGRP